MPFYRRSGDVPKRRHTIVPRGDGYLFEELMGFDGFSQESALLYHLNSPSALVGITGVDHVEPDLSFDHPLEPRHLRTSQLDPVADVVTGRRLLMANSDVRISWASTTGRSPLYRNAIGDELVYVQAGAGLVETSFGELAVSWGDYIVIPRATTHRWRADASGLDVLVVEASGHIRFPKRYMSDTGQLLEGAPFSERSLRAPDTPVQAVEEGPIEVLVRTRGGLSSLVHAHHPFDVVGWDGCLYPFAFNIADFEPIVGAIHQPPPVHQTFAGPGFVMCSFVPRPFDFAPGAIKVPYHHSNVDSDELLLYSRGDFMSRSGSGIGVGSISFHPAGFVHGPQPGSLERARDLTSTEEYAVMIDTFAPLQLTESARAISVPGYAFSWAPDRARPNS